MSSAYRESRVIPLDKIFFVLACLYLGFVVAWLVNRHRSPASAPATAAIPSADRQFIAYLQSSLDLIDRQAKNPPAPSPTVTATPSPTVSLPPPPITPASNPQPRVIERVYVPVYSQPSPAPAASVPTAPVPTAPVKIATAPLPPPPAPTIAVPTPATVTSPPALAPLVPTNDSVKYTLVGVMELGDRATVLFDNQGITTRVSTGEFINGWTLVEVRGQQIILTRGGTTKVLDVGQSF
ncbi:hypothetical protein V0288_13915 [Pannus brasiliensis CCIBt3594]|uniref:Type II secretion system protein GspC N-terminal domain-containing protein n=1 Tax=Pannus brasiliensis CCIBt3594 TaxID=1427578 RepID=A0AAW9QTM2_9CHRO